MARSAYVHDEDLGYEAVVIEDDNGETLEIQMSLYADEQDVALGQDTYCLVRSGAATFYGGVRTWLLADGLLTLGLTDEASQVLGLPTTVAIAVGPADPDELRGQLAGILDGDHGG